MTFRGQTDSDLLRDICDINQWIEPQLNVFPNRSYSTKLDKISLRALPHTGLPMTLRGYTEMEEKGYRATLKFVVNGQVQSYTLYTRPRFITAHPCSGTHVLFRNQVKWYTSNVITASELRTYSWDGRRFLVIAALNEGEECLARAWCSEHGRQAVIRRGHGCCFACAAVMAGEAGLGVNVLIWA